MFCRKDTWEVVVRHFTPLFWMPLPLVKNLPTSSDWPGSSPPTHYSSFYGNFWAYDLLKTWQVRGYTDWMLLAIHGLRSWDLDADGHVSVEEVWEKARQVMAQPWLDAVDPCVVVNAAVFAEACLEWLLRVEQLSYRPLRPPFLLVAACIGLCLAVRCVSAGFSCGLRAPLTLQHTHTHTHTHSRRTPRHPVPHVVDRGPDRCTGCEDKPWETWVYEWAAFFGVEKGPGELYERGDSYNSLIMKHRGAALLFAHPPLSNATSECKARLLPRPPSRTTGVAPVLFTPISHKACGLSWMAMARLFSPPRTPHSDCKK